MKDLLENKKKILATVGVVIVSLIGLVSISLVGKNKIEQTNDSVSIEAGEELNLKATDFFRVDEERAKDIVFHTETVDINTVGTYEMKADFHNKTFAIDVIVKDTQAPKVTFTNRCVFTNGTTQFEQANMIEGVYDASEYTLKLIRFEKKANLEILDDVALKNLTDAIPLPSNTEELMAMGTEQIPEEEGIYRAVMEIADVHGNATYEEVVMILDKTPAKMEDVEDKVVEVSKESLMAEPTINPEDYVIRDNVDGTITSEDIDYELELRDEQKHEWLVHISHTDRAGNESKAEFLITVEETKEQIASNTEKGTEKENTDNKKTETNHKDNTNTQTNNSQKPNKETGNSNVENNSTSNNHTGKNENVENNNTESSNTGSSNKESNSSNKNETDSSVSNNTETDSSKENNPSSDTKQDTEEESNSETTKPDNSANKNENEWIPTDDEKDISPWEQKVIDAGYGNVVDFGDGSYGVLTHGDGFANGKDGFEILDEYLAKKGLRTSSMRGGWIDSDNDWYWCIADNVRELITEDDEEFWD